LSAKFYAIVTFQETWRPFPSALSVDLPAIMHKLLLAQTYCWSGNTNRFVSFDRHSCSVVKDLWLGILRMHNKRIKFACCGYLMENNSIFYLS